jgi:hypothetical protein
LRGRLRSELKTEVKIKLGKTGILPPIPPEGGLNPNEPPSGGRGRKKGRLRKPATKKQKQS